MAANSFFGKLGGKVKNVYNNFFYNGEEDDHIPSAPAAYEPPVEYSAQNPQYQQSGYAQPQHYQTAYQQPSYQKPASYAAPTYQQPAYTQPQPAQQPAYAQPAAQAEAQAAPQRNRRMWAHQNEDNVVDFGAYQQTQQAAASEDPQAAAEALPAGGRAARIINARGMGDCRSAITLLRNGDSVLIVMENVTDPAEMRRLVDTLSGACYSLTATITKVSRYGVYLLAPQSVAVYADQTTNQMNGAPMRPVQQRGYQQPYAAAAQQRPAAQSYQQPQVSYAPQSPFTRRQAPAQEAPRPFYTRTAPQNTPAQPFAAQPAGYGYAPDETAAAE